VLDAWVADGRKAMAVVRGPLADGEALDLGLEAGQQKAGLQKVGLRPMPDDHVSPDVQFNPGANDFVSTTQVPQPQGLDAAAEDFQPTQEWW